MDLLHQVFEETTLLWALILLSLGLITEFFTSWIEFLFDKIIGSRYLRKREAKKMLRKYSRPILQAADSLDRRIENMMAFIDKGWFDDPDDDYYRLSTLYVFGRYFGWCKIVEDETFLEFELSDTEEKEFIRHFYRVFKGINSFYYFESVFDEMHDIENATVPRFALTAIGELMKEKLDKKEGGPPSVIRFVDFAEKYRSNDEGFKEWFSYLENVLSPIENEESNAYWNRLIIFAITLRLMILYLDPKNRLTAHRRTHYLGYLHPEVRARVCRELKKAGYTDIIR